MKPSEKMRKFALKVSSGKFQATCWIVAGIINNYGTTSKRF